MSYAVGFDCTAWSGYRRLRTAKDRQPPARLRGPTHYLHRFPHLTAEYIEEFLDKTTANLSNNTSILVQL